MVISQTIWSTDKTLIILSKVYTFIPDMKLNALSVSVFTFEWILVAHLCHLYPSEISFVFAVFSSLSVLFQL